MIRQYYFIHFSVVKNTLNDYLILIFLKGSILLCCIGDCSISPAQQGMIEVENVLLLFTIS